MVICNYWRFGDITGAQLEKSWSQNGGKYRATLIVQEVVEGCNAMNESCLKMSGDVIGSLYNVELANLWPSAPSIEEWSNSSGDLESTVVM